MAQDPRKAQKKKERRNKREKDKHKAALRRKSVSPLAVFDHLDGSQIVRCATNEIMEEEGITNLYVCREFPNGLNLVAIFLVDLKCLGIKDTTFDVTTRPGAEDIYDQVYSESPGEPMPPEEAKKLCREAAAFAARYGLAPHEDYAKLSKVFADVDDSRCDRVFEFGRDGKPFYISGPNDSLARQRQIVNTLERTAGPGNYEFVLVGGHGPMDDDDDDDFDDDTPPPAPWPAARRW
jgi:hypothetical protein